MQELKVKFLKREQVAKDAYSFYFEKNGLDFTAGQYLRMVLPIQNPDNRGNSRFFTIASSPLEDNLMVTTRIIESSFKKSLISLEEGSIIDIFAPFGNFTLDDNITSSVVFLVGGIGITPARSISLYVQEKRLNLNIKLLASFRTKEDIVYGSEMESMNRENSFLFLPTITDDETFEGHKGRIGESFIRDNVKDLSSSCYYISGPGGFVEAMTNLLDTLNIPKLQIKKETFPGY